jgi:hypothetical protein
MKSRLECCLRSFSIAFALVAQLVEQRFCKPKVTSSILVGGTKYLHRIRGRWAIAVLELIVVESAPSTL